MSIFPDQQIVPVLTLHSVGMRSGKWIWKHLSETAEYFERLVSLLLKYGYRTVTLQQLYSHMLGEELCPPRSIVLVFDDGYLDNWFTVVPILRRFGMKGVVYVNPEFVDPGDKVRIPAKAGGGDRAGSESGSPAGFMNWAELKAVEEMGVLDVQSHSQTHTWYFSSPRIIECYTPQSASLYPWMAWNARPSRKPYYLQEDQRCFVPWGFPIFEYEKALVVKRFHPDRKAVDDVIKAVVSGLDRSEFDSATLQERFEKCVAADFRDSGFPGYTETDDEYEERVRWELATSKATIEEKLEKKVDFLCWPGGGVNEVTRRIAAEVGYKSWTLPSNEQIEKRNRPGDEPMEVKRLPVVRDVHFFGRQWGRGDEILTMLDLLAHQRSTAFNAVRKVYKLGVALGLVGTK